MNPEFPTQVVKYTPKFIINVTVLRGNDLPNIHRISSAAYYVVVKVDDTEKKTTVSTKGNKSPSWGEQFKFDVTTSSSLRITVYCAHPRSSGEDHVVCESREALQIGETLRQNDDVICALYAVHPRSSREKDHTITLQFKVYSFAIPSSTGGNGTIVELPTHGSEFRTIDERWRHFLTSLQSFCPIAKDMAEIDSKAKVAVAAVSVVLKVINDQVACDDNIGNLACMLTECTIG